MLSRFVETPNFNWLINVSRAWNIASYVRDELYSVIITPPGVMCGCILFNTGVNNSGT